MPNPKVDLDPPPSIVQDFGFQWKQWLHFLYERIGGNSPFKIKGYTVSTLPDASMWANNTSEKEFSGVVYVTDETGGATLAFSDGTNWRRVQDRAIVS